MSNEPENGRQPVVFVSSVVYGFETDLDILYATLQSYGYEVWMSRKGTIPVNSKLSAAENCVEAVAKCDIFFGIIGKRYGSGKDESMEKSIMHLEISRSIELDKLRWFMVDHDVVVARNILKQYRFDKEGNPRPDFAFERTAMLEDIRTLELYEEVIQQGEKALKDRKGNWVQEYRTWSDVTLFVDSQLKNIELTKELIANGREVEK